MSTGWHILRNGIAKLEDCLEGLVPTPFTNSSDYISLYTTVYDMCTQPPPYYHARKLYENYERVYVDYLCSKVLPSLREKHGVHMLTELVKRWQNHKLMVRWLSHLFYYLDCDLVQRESLPSLKEVGLKTFRDLVYGELGQRAKDAVIAWIDKALRAEDEIDIQVITAFLEIMEDNKDMEGAGRRLEKMVRDLRMARENQRLFELYTSNDDVEFRVDLLSKAVWPTYPTTGGLHLPDEMAKCVGAYEDLYRAQYKDKHNKKKLQWVHSLGSCHLKAHFGSKTVELVVAPYQAVVLMLFNTSDRLTYSEIQSRSGLSDQDCSRVLHSVACSPYQILTKDPRSEMVSPSDAFAFNPTFTIGSHKIEIPLPSSSVEAIHFKVEGTVEDRRYAIDAAIIRVMKAKKVLDYQDLKAKVVDLLSQFELHDEFIERRVDALVSRDFLERDDENPNLLRYIP